MDSALATTIILWGLRGLGVYLLLGVVFVTAFHLGGLRRIDSTTAGASLAFRILVTPGVITLWPLLLASWWRGDGRLPREHNAHRDGAEAP